MLAPISAELIALMFLPVKQTESADKKFMTGQARRDFPAQVSFDFAIISIPRFEFLSGIAPALLFSIRMFAHRASTQRSLNARR
jgi:hypothetical protein